MVERTRRVGPSIADYWRLKREGAASPRPRARRTSSGACTNSTAAWSRMGRRPKPTANGLHQNPAPTKSATAALDKPPLIRDGFVRAGNPGGHPNARRYRKTVYARLALWLRSRRKPDFGSSAHPWTSRRATRRAQRPRRFRRRRIGFDRAFFDPSDDRESAAVSVRPRVFAFRERLALAFDACSFACRIGKERNEADDPI